MSTKEEQVWAGSEASYQSALDAEARLAAGDFADVEDDDCPRLLSVQDGLAVISIRGPLVNKDSPFLRYCGVVGYPEIREAVIAAVSDPNVTQILLDVESGGGAVSGCADTAAVIRAAHKVKPVTAYGEMMASAAYWLSCSAGKVYSSKAALVGSIGVIATFREYSEQNKMEGVKVTIVRAGKYKALANPNEPLTEAAKAQIQAQCDANYEVFVDHVAEMRARSYEYTDKTMADGQEFIGQAAVDVGLTDGITTFDAVVGGLRKKILASLSKTMDNGNKNRFSLSGSITPTTPEDVPMAKKALTEADIAALAAGATVEAVVTAVTDPADSPDMATAEVKDGMQTEKATEEVAEQVATIDPTIQYLQSQIKDKDIDLLQAGIKLAKVEDQLAALRATVDPMLAIAVKSAHNMALALNSVSTVSLATPVEQVLAEHARLSEMFQKKYPVGGVAAVPADSDAGAGKAYVMTNVTQAQIKAVRGYN